MLNTQSQPTQNVAPVTKALFSVEDTMTVLDASRTKVNALICQGAIVSFRDGKRRKIVASSVYAYIDRMARAA